MIYRPPQIAYLVRESVMGLVRRRISGTVAIVIMGSSLLMLTLFSLITINLDRVLQTLRGDVDVIVYLRDGMHDQDQALLHRDLVGMVGVRSVTYVSREQALERFRVELGEDADLLAALRENPLPASLELRLDPRYQEPQRLRDMTRVIEEYPGVEEVVAQIQWVQRLDRITKAFLWVDLVVGILVLLSSLFVISNTVRLTVEESGETIEIMKLVGATNWFIRWPFFLGGALQGAMAGIFAMLILALASRVVQEQVRDVFFFHPLQLLGFVVLSTVLGGAGSLVALRRHLRL